MTIFLKNAIGITVVLLCFQGLARAEVKIGLLLPYSGIFSSVGNEIDKGFVLALEEANIQFDITTIREDTEFKPRIGLAKVKKLIMEDEVLAIVGVASSAVLAAVRRLVHENETPLIVANAGNDHETGIDCSRYIVRVSFSNAQVSRPMGQWMYAQGVRKVYTMAPDYSAGHQIIRAFSNEFLEAGGLIIGADLTPSRKVKDFTPYLEKVKKVKPDAIFAFYAGGEAISYVKQYAAFGFSEDVGLYGPGFLTSPLYVNAQGDAAIGVIASMHYVPTLDTPQNAKFVKAYQAKFDGKLPSEYTVQGYDAGWMLTQVLKKGAKSRKEIAKILPKVKYTGPRGPLKIDKKTNNIVQNIYIYQTVKEADSLTQKILGVVEKVRDKPRGCKL